ncbi:MAG: signal peptidase I [Acidobacteria bacterium]|nr:signal peptidase I [Acidobacteriota bacterium]MBI3656207.1 signal peptidase I [Acidobacteriota bacterium]
MEKVKAKVKEAKKPDVTSAPGVPESVGILREYYITIITCLVLALFVTTFVAHPMSVPTESMVPTILVGDRLIVDKFTLRVDSLIGRKLALGREIKRGDIVVFKFPRNPETPYVKRVIGLPNETITIRKREIFINGQRWEDPYGRYMDPQIELHYRDNHGPITIPPESYFVMGDNRDNSADSRYWGMVPASHIIGRPLFVFWSYADPPYQEIQSQNPVMVYLDRIIHFPTKTRWGRMGRQIK